MVGFGCGLCCRFFFIGWLGVEVVVGGDGCSCGRDYDCGWWWQQVLAVAVGLLVVNTN